VETGVTPTNRWAFVVITASTSNGASVYIDATVEGTNSVSGIDHRDGIGIGCQSSASKYFNGRIGPVWVWDTELSSSDVQTLYDITNTNGTLTTAVKTS